MQPETQANQVSQPVSQPASCSGQRSPAQGPTQPRLAQLSNAQPSPAVPSPAQAKIQFRPGQPSLAQRSLALIEIPKEALIEALIENVHYKTEIH